jgi:hypothetical protein
MNSATTRRARCSSSHFWILITVALGCSLALGSCGAPLGRGDACTSSGPALSKANLYEPLAESKSKVVRFQGLAPLKVHGGFPRVGWPGNGVVIAPGAREVVLKPFGRSSDANGRALVIAAGFVTDADENELPGVIFQPVDVALLSTRPSTAPKLRGLEGFFLEHDGRFLVGDWGREDGGGRGAARGALCVLLDKEDRPCGFVCMDDLTGPKRLLVDLPSSDLLTSWTGRGFPQGGVCGFRDSKTKQDHVALLMKRVVDDEARLMLNAWSGEGWRSSDWSIGFSRREDRSEGVVPVDMRMSWTGRSFEALLAVAEPGFQARLLKLSWDASVTELRAPGGGGGSDVLDSYHLVGCDFSMLSSQAGPHWAVLHSTGAGYPNQRIGNQNHRTTAWFYGVSLGSNPKITTHQLEVGSFWKNQNGMQGIRLHSFFPWLEDSTKSKGLFVAQGDFSTCYGLAEQVKGRWIMTNTQCLPMHSTQFLGSMALLGLGASGTSILAPNLCFGTIAQPPSSDPLTLVRIERGSSEMSVRSVRADEFIANRLTMLVRSALPVR